MIVRFARRPLCRLSNRLRPETEGRDGGGGLAEPL
jgi:hypothetical protein